MKTGVAAYVITRDEEARIDRAVRSLLAVTPHVLVVDSDSTDRTREVAASAGADVAVHPFAGYAQQRNWAVDALVARHDPDWVLTIDADEWLDESLVRELVDLAERDGLDADVYLVRRRVRFDGRVLRHGGWSGTYLPRLFRPRTARYEDREVNEHLDVPSDAVVGRLHGTIEHDDVTSWEAYIEKHNRYSSMEARARRDAAAAGRRPSLSDALRHRHLRRRWLRQRVFDRLPARPALRFVQLYILSAGFLDGRAGFRRALFEAWQEMCIDLKTESLDRGGTL